MPRASRAETFPQEWVEPGVMGLAVADLEDDTMSSGPRRRSTMAHHTPAIVQQARVLLLGLKRHGEVGQSHSSASANPDGGTG